MRVVFNGTHLSSAHVELVVDFTDFVLVVAAELHNDDARLVQQVLISLCHGTPA